MRKVETYNFLEMKKLDTERSKSKRYCKFCGHSIIFNQTAKTNKILCTYCGHYIFKNDLIEFRYRIKEKSKKI